MKSYLIVARRGSFSRNDLEIPFPLSSLRVYAPNARINQSFPGNITAWNLKRCGRKKPEIFGKFVK